MSKEQQKLLGVIKGFYPLRIIENYRPDNLKNKKTGKNLELDIFLFDHFVGVEYQGMIHFKRIERYKNNPDDSRKNDNLKNDLISGFNRFAIIEIFPQDLTGNIKENFIKRLLITQELYFDRQEFKKCKSLEMLYLYINGVKNKATAKIFDRINEVNIHTNLWKRKLEIIATLKNFFSVHTFYHGDRKYFSPEFIYKYLKIDDENLLKSVKKRIYFANRPTRDKTGVIIQNILSNKL